VDCLNAAINEDGVLLVCALRLEVVAPPVMVWVDVNTSQAKAIPLFADDGVASARNGRLRQCRTDTHRRKAPSLVRLP